MTLTPHPAAPAFVAPMERLDQGRVKGTVLRAHLDWVRDSGSREQTIEFFESLPPEVLRYATNTLPSAWYPFAALIGIDRVIVTLFGQGRSSFAEELGRYSAHRNLAAVATLLEGTDPHLYFRRTSLLHGQFQDFGTASWIADSASSGTMLHTKYVCYSPLYCASAVGFYREALRMHGRSNTHVRETSCQCLGENACRFELSWS